MARRKRILADPRSYGQTIPKLREALSQAVPQHKPIYIADAAVVDKDNLQTFAELRLLFISLLPSTYKGETSPCQKYCGYTKSSMRRRDGSAF